MIGVGVLSGLGAGLTALGEKILIPTAAAIGAAGCRYVTDKIFDGIDSIGDSYSCNNYRTSNRNNYYPELPKTLTNKAEEAPPVVKEFIEDTVGCNNNVIQQREVELLPYQVMGEDGIVRNRILMDYDDYIKMMNR